MKNNIEELFPKIGFAFNKKIMEFSDITRNFQRLDNEKFDGPSLKP